MTRPGKRLALVAAFAFACAAYGFAQSPALDAHPRATGSTAATPNATLALPALAATLQVGDIVFTRIPFPPFTRITEVTGGWSNHVGVVVDIAGGEPLIAESKVPLSRVSPLSSFLRRSDHGRAAVLRPAHALDAAQQQALARAVDARMGVLYDTGFNLASTRQFCSRFVREVLAEATGVHYGELQRFDALLASNPGADQRFWRLWYFGQIPWNRVTVTPEAIRRDARLTTVFDGHVVLARL